MASIRVGTGPRSVTGLGTDPTQLEVQPYAVGAASPRNRALRDFVSVADYGTWTSATSNTQNILAAAVPDAVTRGKRLYIPGSPGGAGTTWGGVAPIATVSGGNSLNIIGDGSSSVIDYSALLGYPSASGLTALTINGVLGSQILGLAATDMPQGSTVISLVNGGTAGLSVGQRIFIGSSDSTQTSTSQKPGEIGRIVAVNAGANQVTVATPLHALYASAATNYIYPITPSFGNRFAGFQILGPPQIDPTMTTNGTTSVTGISPALPVGQPYSVQGASGTLGIADGTTLTITGAGTTGTLSATATLSASGAALCTPRSYGIQASYWEDFMFEEVETFQCHYDGLSFINCTDGRIVGGESRDCLMIGAAVGIAFGYACQNITVEGHTCRNAWHAVAIGGGSSTPGGWPRHIKSVGVQAINSNLNCHPCGEHISFVDCDVDGPVNVPTATADGITFNAPVGQILGCSIRNAGRHGILIQPASTQNTVVLVDGNEIYNPAQNGISMTPVGGYNTGYLIDIGDNNHLYQTASIAYDAIEALGMTGVRIGKLRARGPWRYMVNLDSTSAATTMVDPGIDTAGWNDLQFINVMNFGTSTLVAGTVTVSNASITANSIVKTWNIGKGGTVGALSVTLNAGTGFTITSTSGSDTSKIRWEIVSY